MNKIILIIALFMGSIFTANAQKVTAKKEFNSTLKAYFETKNALAKDNTGLARESVMGVLNSLENFPVKSLNAEQQKLWKTEAEVIKNAALDISTEKELATQRKSFWSLSSAMIKLAKEFNLNNEAIYVQYCPMAKKSWLNEVEAIQNPFYGSKMYACGDVTETIAKN